MRQPNHGTTLPCLHGAVVNGLLHVTSVCFSIFLKASLNSPGDFQDMMNEDSCSSEA